MVLTTLKQEESEQFLDIDILLFVYSIATAAITCHIHDFTNMKFDNIDCENIGEMKVEVNRLTISRPYRIEYNKTDFEIV